MAVIRQIPTEEHTAAQVEQSAAAAAPPAQATATAEAEALPTTQATEAESVPQRAERDEATTTASAAVVGGAVGFLLGGPMLGLLSSAGLACSTRREDEIGRFSRGVALWGLDASDAVKAKTAELGVIDRITAAGVAAQAQAARIDAEHRISERAAAAGETVRAEAVRIDQEHRVSEQVAAAGETAQAEAMRIDQDLRISEQVAAVGRRMSEAAEGVAQRAVQHFGFCRGRTPEVPVDPMEPAPAMASSLVTAE